MPAAGTEWTAANNKLRWNLNASTGLSIGAGFLGADFGGAYDIGGGRYAVHLGDTNIATAAGQQPIFGSKAASTGNGGAPRTKAVRNSMMIFDNYDFSAMTNPVAYYSTDPDGEPQAYFRDITINGTTYFRFPSSGAVVDGKLYMIGSLVLNTPGEGIGFATQGNWAVEIDNISATPDNWIVTELPMYTSTDPYQNPFLAGGIDIGDGYIYAWGGMPGGQTAGRWKKSDFVRGDFMKPEYWVGLDGVYAPDQNQSGARAFLNSTQKVRGNAIQYTPPNAFQFPQANGSWLRSDGLWQWQSIPGSPITSGAGTPMPDAWRWLTYKTWPQSRGPVVPFTTPPTDFFQMPAGPDRIHYSAQPFPLATWSGKPAGPTAQVWMYSTNGGQDNYFPHFVQCTGLTAT